MSSPHRPKVAGFQPEFPPPPQTPSTSQTDVPEEDRSAPAAAKSGHTPSISDHLASWISDLTSLHDLVERLAATATLDDALQEVLRAGATLVGARRGFLALEPADGTGPERTIGLGLGRTDLGQIETVPRHSASYARLLDGLGSETRGDLLNPRTGTAGRSAGTAEATAGTITGTGTSTLSGTGPGPSPGTGPGSGASERRPITRPGSRRSNRAGPPGSDPPGDDRTAGSAGGATPGSAGSSREADESAGDRARDSSDTSGQRSGSTDSDNDSAGNTGSTGGLSGGPSRTEIVHADIATDESLDPRHREVAARLGYAASYAVPLGAGTESSPRTGAAVWLYDEPAEPTPAQRHLLALYLRCAAQHLARHVELARVHDELSALGEELLPSRLPRVPGVALARRHRTGPYGGGDWYDVLPLPEGALGLTVGGVTGGGPSAVAARARMQASLRAYAVMEGEDPVAVLSDLELLLRLTEPARAATALFAYAEPATRRVVVAGAGHCPPLLVGPHRTEFVETTLSAPLGMLACWEAPSVELTLRPEETLLLYSDGLLHRTGEDTDRAFARLQAAAAAAPPAVRADPDALADHILLAMLPPEPVPADSGRPAAERRDEHPEDVVLLAARF